MNTAKLITLGMLRGSGAADTSASFTATTTGAQTLTINGLGVTSATTVNWGDGNSDSYTGNAARTHNYAGAGTWTVRIVEPWNVNYIDLRDAKITDFQGAQFAKMPLTWLIAIGCGGITWTVSASAPLPVTLTNLILVDLSGVTYVSEGLDTLPNLVTLRYENRLLTAQVDGVLAQLWAGFAEKTGAAGTIDLLGTLNEGPTGPVAAETPPTYGGAYAYELVNDTGNVNPTKKWTSVTTATPV